MEQEPQNLGTVPGNPSTDSCPVPGVKVDITRADIPDKSDPLQVVLAVMVSLEGSPSTDVQVGDLQLDTVCQVGSEATMLRDGAISNRRAEPQAVLLDCTIRVNNDDDCLWNTLNVSTTARLQGSQCSETASAEARYCRGTLRPKEIPELPAVPESELPPCTIPDFNVDFEKPVPSPDNPKLVRFPMATTFTAPESASSAPKYVRFCSVGVDKGAIVNERVEDGVSKFDCAVEFKDETDCSTNSVVVQSTVIVDGGKDTSQCSRSTERRLVYCVERKAVVAAPKECTIEKFDLSIVDIKPVTESGLLMGIDVSASYGGVELGAPELVEDFEFSCVVGAGEKKKRGEIADKKVVKRQVTFTCKVEIEDGSECSENVIEIEGKMKRIGANRTCSKIAEIKTVYCPEKVPQVPVLKKEEEKCALKNLVVTVVGVDSVEDDPYGLYADALVKVTYDGYDPKWEKKLEFQYLCIANGHQGTTTGVKPIKGGFLFTCRFSTYDSYDSLENVIEARASAHLKWYGKSYCGHEEVVTTYHHCTKPDCSFFPINLSYEGSWGLVTDDDDVEIGMLCSHPVDVCPDCFQVWSLCTKYPEVKQ